MTKPDFLKGARWLLVKNPENPKDDEPQRLAAMLAASPELKQYYALKEEFRARRQSEDQSCSIGVPAAIATLTTFVCTFWWLF